MDESEWGRHIAALVWIWKGWEGLEVPVKDSGSPMSYEWLLVFVVRERGREGERKERCVEASGVNCSDPKFSCSLDDLELLLSRFGCSCPCSSTEHERGGCGGGCHLGFGDVEDGSEEVNRQREDAVLI